MDYSKQRQRPCIVYLYAMSKQKYTVVYLHVAQRVRGINEKNTAVIFVCYTWSVTTSELFKGRLWLIKVLYCKF